MTLTGLLSVLCGVLGLAIGSFINVVIWRVPRGMSIVAPPSSCPRCGHPVRARDNVPVLSWVLLRGRCRDCGEPISPRYPAVELLTAALFAWMPWLITPPAALPAYLWLAGAGVALAAIDLDVKRLPNAIVYPTTVVVIGWLAIVGVFTDLGATWRTLLAALILGGLYLLLHLAYPRGMGFGDVKLALPIGAALGFDSWQALAVGGFAAFVLGAVVG